MEDYGFWSVLPPVIAIFLAIRTKMVYVALILGIWIGWMVISNWNPLVGTLATVEAFVEVFKDAGNTRTVMFSALVGALLVFIQHSGGVEGFILKVNKLLNYFENKKKGNNRVVVQLLALFTGMLLFIETSINILTVGSLYRPIFDKLKIPREKLAFIVDSSAAPSSILIPLNAWGAFIMGLLLAQGFEQPFQMLYSAMPFNFYPMLAIGTVFFVIVSKKDFGPMVQAEKRMRESGKLLNDGARPMVSADITYMEKKEGVTPKAYNMIVPVVLMVLLMPVNLAFTGWANVSNAETLSFAAHTFKAIGLGSGSASVLYSVLAALLVAMVMYRVQNIMKTREMVELALKGISGLMPLALLMVLAFAISMDYSRACTRHNLCSEFVCCFCNGHFVGYICYYDDYFGANGANLRCKPAHNHCGYAWWRCFWRPLFAHFRYHNFSINGFGNRPYRPCTNTIAVCPFDGQYHHCFVSYFGVFDVF